ERDRTKRRRDRQAFFKVLGAQRIPKDRRRYDVKVEGKFLHLPRPSRAGLFAARDPIFAALGSLPQAVEFYIRGVKGRRINDRTPAEFQLSCSRSLAGSV